MSEPKKSLKPTSDPVQRAVEAIAKWLSTADRTESELRDRMEKRLIPPEVADEAIARVQAYGWLDDQRVAERQIQKDREQRLLGKGRVKQRLLNRGLDGESLVSAEEEERDRAIALLRRQRQKWDSAASAARGLASRGYDEDAIRAALDSEFPGWEFGESGNIDE
ncbi:MAG: regulatory protein RecX [Fimbriimonadaceae bacterium]|nr:regulatory protein RecX [Fimbriimonadaceae bacterium]